MIKRNKKKLKHTSAIKIFVKNDFQTLKNEKLLNLIIILCHSDIHICFAIRTMLWPKCSRKIMNSKIKKKHQKQKSWEFKTGVFEMHWRWWRRWKEELKGVHRKRIKINFNFSSLFADFTYENFALITTQ